jgi:very-short-patch-repair endonuclease
VISFLELSKQLWVRIMEENKIVKAYNAGKSTYEIAKEYNTYANKVRRILIKHGVAIKSKSDAQKNALKNGTAKIPTQGQKRTKEERLKISKGLQERWTNISDEEYEKHVEQAKKRWSKLTALEKKNMASAASSAIRKAGKEGSKLEKFLKDELTRCGYKVEAHKKNLIPNERLEIDMYFPKLKTIIEIDGPSHFLPVWGEDKLQKQIKSDKVKTGLILSKGFAIIRVKHLSDSLSLSRQEELKNNLIELLESIESKFPQKSKRYIEIET